MVTIFTVAGAGGVAAMECGVDKHLVAYYVSHRSNFSMTKQGRIKIWVRGQMKNVEEVKSPMVYAYTKSARQTRGTGRA